MELYTSLAEAPETPSGRSAALGTFDGVHRGHRRVITAAVEHARTHGQRAIVVTFDPHPTQVLRPDDAPPRLTDTLAKAEIVAGLGADELIAIPFTQELAQIEPEAFVSDVLLGALDTRHLSVGANFRFGRGARGDVELLRRHSEFDTSIAPLVEYSGATVSSSRIRDLIAVGDVAHAAELLETPYRLTGEVVSGDARGRELGMRTANIAPAAEMLVPGTGIYAATARVDESEVPAAVSIGVRPTFGEGGDVRVEAHLIGWDGDLYAHTLRLSFLERLRDEVKFDSAEDLQRQMRADVEQVERIASR